jgi:hypothetical protein
MLRHRILTARRRSTAPTSSCAEISKLPYVFFKPPKRRRGKRNAYSLEQCDAFFLGLGPVGHPLCVCQCRDDTSLATCHRSSQPRLRRSGLSLRSASAADPLRRQPQLRRPLEIWRGRSVAGALRLRARRSALCRHLCRIAQTKKAAWTFYAAQHRSRLPLAVAISHTRE